MALWYPPLTATTFAIFLWSMVRFSDWSVINCISLMYNSVVMPFPFAFYRSRWTLHFLCMYSSRRSRNRLPVCLLCLLSQSQTMQDRKSVQSQRRCEQNAVAKEEQHVFVADFPPPPHLIRERLLSGGVKWGWQKRIPEWHLYLCLRFAFAEFVDPSDLLNRMLSLWLSQRLSSFLE